MEEKLGSREGVPDADITYAMLSVFVGKSKIAIDRAINALELNPLDPF